VLVEADQALDQCHGLVSELDATDSLLTSAQRRVSLAHGAYQRGEVTRLEVAFAELGAVRAAHARQTAVRRAWLVRARLEAAVGVWATDGPARWPDVIVQPQRSDSKEAP
jgi:outer membrane protein TolC